MLYTVPLKTWLDAFFFVACMGVVIDRAIIRALHPHPAFTLRWCLRAAGTGLWWVAVGVNAVALLQGVAHA